MPDFTSRQIFLETNRFVILVPTEEDFKHWLALHNDKFVMRFIGAGATWSEELVSAKFNKDIAHFKKYGYGFGSVFDKQTGEFVGCAGIFHFTYDDLENRQEIGARLSKKYWHAGVATELGEAILNWAKPRYVEHDIVAVVDPKNFESQDAVIKVGLTLVSKDAFFYNKTIHLYKLANGSRMVKSAEISDVTESSPKICLQAKL